MKKTLLTLIALLISNLIFCQVLKFQFGTSISKLNWNLNSFSLDYYDEPIVGFSGSFGMDYFINKNYNFSSNIGLIRKGGKATLIFTPMVPDPAVPEGEHVDKAILNYLTLNTTFDFKFPIREIIIPYVSFGPRIDYLVSYSQQFDGLNEMKELNKVSYGLIFGVGLKYNVSKFQIGVKGDYYLNFNKIADWKVKPGENLGGKISDKTLLINFTIGYIFK